MGFPDICKVPDPKGTFLDTLYPDGILIYINKHKSEGNVYEVEGGRASILPIQDVVNTTTFIILDDGSVSVYKQECRSPAAARRAVEIVIGSNITAMVISIDKDGKKHRAFHVKPRSVRRKRIPFRQLP